MEEPFVAVWPGAPHLHDLHFTAPIGSRSDGAAMRVETDQGCFISKALAAQLPDVELGAHSAHFGVSRVANVGIVSPDDRLRAAAVSSENVPQRVEHMRVA